jgi:hypothetical protein
MRVTASAVALFVGVLCTGCGPDEPTTPDASIAPGASSAVGESAADSSASDPAAPATTSTLPPGPTAPVAPPTPGNITDIVPAVEPTLLPEVALTDSATPADGITISLTDLSQVDAQTHVPGEVSGPAVRVSIEIGNSGAQPVDLTSVVVELSDSDGAPGIPVSTADSKSFDGMLDPNASITGVYVFRVPVDRRDPILIAVSYAAGSTVAQFSGSLG